MQSNLAGTSKRNAAFGRLFLLAESLRDSKRPASPQVGQKSVRWTLFAGGESLCIRLHSIEMLADVHNWFQ